ncbi:hypothetical protein HYQ44_004115 [Verticillium longisporum]|nr:hypothetical protein HYQ44_004115 [Verticillium longisporum]
MSAMEGDPPPELTITPPLLNSANPWATTLEDLQAIFDSPHTAAITTRTTLLDGFEHDDAVHQYAFFSPTTSLASSSARQRAKGESAPAINPQEHAATVNNLGYSPYPLSKYLAFLKKIHKTVDKKSPQHLKPIIVSVTGTPQEIRRCYDRLDAFQDEVPNLTIAMEINLSCPNIADAPPPAYTAAGLKAYLDVLPAAPDLPVGIKTPPYTYATQFADLLDVLRKSCITSIEEVEERDRTPKPRFLSHSFAMHLSHRTAPWAVMPQAIRAQPHPMGKSPTPQSSPPK